MHNYGFITPSDATLIYVQIMYCLQPATWFGPKGHYQALCRLQLCLTMSLLVSSDPQYTSRYHSTILLLSLFSGSPNSLLPVQLTIFCKTNICVLHGYTVHITMLKPFYYQLMHIMLKNTELLKHSKITLQHVSVYIETIFRELQSVLG